jgi:endonuclease/exonuclease/phosphatase family metal-dependent hydrolase
VFNTHLDYRADPRVRLVQVSEMLNYVGASAMPTIVCGDMNATPDAAELAPLRQKMADAWTVAGDAGYTYPPNIPPSASITSSCRRRLASAQRASPSRSRRTTGPWSPI